MDTSILLYAASSAKNEQAKRTQARELLALDGGGAVRFWVALQLKERCRISYWDAAIIAAARELGCQTVYSEDLNDGQVYAGVRVINPFVG